MLALLFRDGLIHSMEIGLRIYLRLIIVCLCAVPCSAQAKDANQALLEQARAKYDAPFAKNLQSFDCAVEFDWQKHFKEAPRVGDEGTDEEIGKLIQPIKTRVVVTSRSVTVSPELTQDDEKKLPYNGMAEGLLQHAVQRSLYTWLPVSNNVILPGTDIPVSFKKSSLGFEMMFKKQNYEIDMVFNSDMRLERVGSKANPSDHIDALFVSGDKGFLLSTWTMGEGEFKKGNRLIYSYTYQTVDGVTIPATVAINRESHHEMWHYALTGCTVKMNP
jgi:hypothetical protein